MLLRELFSSRGKERLLSSCTGFSLRWLLSLRSRDSRAHSSVVVVCVSQWVESDSLWPRQAPLSMGFSRQEYWSGLPCPPPGDPPDPGMNPGLLHCRQTLYPLSLQGGPSGCGPWTPLLQLQALEHMLSSCGTWVYVSRSMWDLPRPEIKLLSPALAGGFFATGSPGKPQNFVFKQSFKRIQKYIQWAP